MLFSKANETWFLARKIFSLHFQVRHTYEKQCSESRLAFGRTQSIIRCVEMISRQLRAIFVDF